jgi:hypothetical protein
VTSAILCPDVTIPNGNISTTNGLRVGSIISYKCQEGYTIEGSDAATCTNDGVWSDKTPTCKGTLSLLHHLRLCLLSIQITFHHTHISPV